jgi:hypothetical protein
MAHLRGGGVRLGGLALLVVSTLAAPTRGDAGLPNLAPQPSVRVQVSFQGRPIAPGEFQAVLLMCPSAPGSGQWWKNRPQPGDKLEPFPLPHADQLPLKDDQGTWVPDRHWVSWPGKDGRVDFTPKGFSPKEREGCGGIKRLAIYLPEHDRSYLTRSIGINGYRPNYLAADLSPEGTGTIKESLPPIWDYLGWAPLLTLGVTLVVELGMVVVWIFAIRRKFPDRRVLLAWLVGNLITHPLVWYASIVAKTSPGGDKDFIPVFLAAELGAVIIEGVLYARVGRLSWAHAFGLSFTANTASVIFGFCLLALS